MKLRNYIELMGLRRKATHYGYTERRFELDCGSIRYARWNHPKEGDKEITNEQVDAYRQWIGPGDFCIDIGAHTGDSTLPMALAATASGCALAMEPNPYVFHVLDKNARANASLANIRPMLAAVAPEQSFLEFEYSDAGYCNGGRHENIPALKHGHPYKLEVFAVDLASELETDFARWLPFLRFIKVDTEGFDLYVLKSLERVLRQYQPTIKAEVFKDTDEAYRQELLLFLTSLGYFVYRIEAEPITPGEPVTADNVMSWGHYDVLAVPAGSDSE